MAGNPATHDSTREADLKRRRRELIAVGVAASVLVAFVLAQTELPPLTRHTSLVSNLVVILLFDISFLLLGLLLLLVGRNLAKVIFEHRRGLIGSKFQVRLVFGFIAVALVPSLFLLVVSGAFLRADVASWFNPEYQRVLDDSLDIAKVYYLSAANNAAHFARELAGEVSAKDLLRPERRADLKSFIEQRQQDYNLGTIEVFDSSRQLLLIALSPRTPTGIGVAPDSPLLAQTLRGHATTRTDRFGKSDVIRGSAPIYSSPESDTVTGAVVVDYYLPRSLAQRAAGISQTFEDYFQLRTLRQPIVRSYFLALMLIGLVVVLLASWFGMYLARGVTVPIKLLAEGTQAVAHGDLEHEIPSVGDDEIGQLVTSFNQMTADLRASQTELERRRAYTETLLRNVSAGVVGLDPLGAVTAINRYAERMLGLKAAEVLGRRWRVVFQPALVDALEETFAEHRRPHEARSSVKLQPPGGGEIELMVTASALGDSADGELGTVLFLEDVSQLAKVERMEAWREVARRIAHEIKNPLTPDPALGRADAPAACHARRRRRETGRRVHSHHHWRGRGPQAPGERVLGLRADAASQPGAGRSQSANRGDGRDLSRRQPARRLRASAGDHAATDRDRPRRAQARTGQPARERGQRRPSRQPERGPAAHRREDGVGGEQWRGDARSKRQRPRHPARAALADFRALLFHAQGRDRPGPGDRLRHRRRPSRLHPGARQPAQGK
jgi:two-component system nitrogen regulation sensor histidine kinase NtrY